MNLKQLRMLREIERHDLNLSAAAAALHASQPGVSRQVQLLERELGVDLLLRRTNRILGFTEAGRGVLAAAQRLLAEAETIAQIAAEARGDGAGRLVLATTHLHARYTLPEAVRQFAARHPGVQMHLLQAEPDDISELVARQEADIGISTEIGPAHPDLVSLAAGPLRRSLIMPAGHPLARRRRLSLADIADHPLVSYHPRSRGGEVIGRAFREAGIAARHVVSASDSDVIKAYVVQGLGIAVVPTIAFDRHADAGLHAKDVTGLFPESVMTLSLRRGTHLRRYLTDFIRMVVPRFDRGAVERAMHAAGDHGAAKPLK